MYDIIILVMIMYSYIKGIVKDQESNYIVLDNNGIGYHIFVANPFQFSLEEEAKVYIYDHIREDEHSLYGFQTKEEKELFLKLLNVKGVGPKLIMPMLATGSVKGIVDAIDRENILYLTNYYRPTFDTYVRFGTGFNLSNTKLNLQTGQLQQVNWDHLKSRIEPLLLEAGYNSPGGDFCRSPGP